MRTDDPAAQATAHQLVQCVLQADSDGLTETLETVVDQPAHELRPYIREVVAELINVATEAVRNSVGGVVPFRGAPAFAVDLRDDENERVGIDELDPPVRATIRAMLAELNGSSDDASFQLDLVVRGVDHRTGLDTVRRALTMTVGLLHWSEQSEQVETLADPGLSSGEEELAGQRFPAVPDEDENFAELHDLRGFGPVEADPADVRDQRGSLPRDEEDGR